LVAGKSGKLAICPVCQTTFELKQLPGRQVCVPSAPPLVMADDPAPAPSSLSVVQPLTAPQYPAMAQVVNVHIHHDRSPSATGGMRCVAVLLNMFFIPGLGQFILGRPGRGAFIMLSFFGSMVFTLFLLLLVLAEPITAITLPFGFLPFCIWVYSLIDAATGESARSPRRSIRPRY
jgi:hypothetical protein